MAALVVRLRAPNFRLPVPLSFLASKTRKGGKGLQTRTPHMLENLQFGGHSEEFGRWNRSLAEVPLAFPPGVDLAHQGRHSSNNLELVCEKNVPLQSFPMGDEFEEEGGRNSPGMTTVVPL